jgi:hypothetical protein
MTEKLNLRIMHGVPVMTEKEIQTLCLKYHLKFLPSRSYGGTVPPEVGTTIFNFMNKIGSPNPEHSAQRLWIVAPPKAFKLKSYKITKAELDPLLFYRIESEKFTEPMYALVTKWGDDFTVMRRLSGFLYSNRVRHAHIMRLVWFAIIFAVTCGFAELAHGLTSGFSIFLAFASLGLAVLGRGIVRDYWRGNGWQRKQAHDELFEDGWNVDRVHEHKKLFI